MTAKITMRDVLEQIREQNAENAQVLGALLNAQAEQMQAITAVLAVVATDIGRIARAMAPAAPNYREALANYGAYNWEALGAEVLATDNDGATAILWNGYQWKRRSGTGRYGKAIWFNRPEGKDEEGNVKYLRLITFKDLDPAEPLTFQRPDPDQNGSDGNSGLHPAARSHLTYTDGTPVPANQQTIEIFNAFCYVERRKPESAAELRAWHEHHQGEEQE